MADLLDLIRPFLKITDHPESVFKRYLAEGKKVVGCFPVYLPEELVHAAGMVPMGLWGGQIAPALAGKYNPIFTCSIMRSCLEYGMTGVYDGMTCALLPILCDTFRGMVSSWRAGTSIPLLPLIHPQNREDPGARDFLVSEYQSLRARLERVAGCSITDEALSAAIEVYNEHSRIMMRFAAVANEHLDVVTPKVRHAVMKSGTFLEKKVHTGMVRSLIEGLESLPRHDWKGKKTILSGITAEPSELLDMLAENDIAVVGDDLAQESRLYRTLIPEGAAPLERLAGQWLDRHDCSLVHETTPNRGKFLAGMAKEAGADSVTVCLMRFCDVEEYDYPYLSKSVEDAGLRCLCLEIDQSTQTSEQTRTKIQSYAEMQLM